VSTGWVLLVRSAAPPAGLAPEAPWAGDPRWLVWLGWAVLPALGEEWLCRGVLWEAARRALGAAGTIALTATLFGFLHALNGGLLLEVPHRLAFGLLLGWLRWRSGSLGPCVLAHLVHNGLAILAE
jgi:membrane protease YdiL (CAAX protease family)